jgi:hypothetical protein
MLRWPSWTKVSSAADLAIYYGDCSIVVLANSARGATFERPPPLPIWTGFEAAAGSLALDACRVPPPPRSGVCRYRSDSGPRADINI